MCKELLLNPVLITCWALTSVHQSIQRLNNFHQHLTLNYLFLYQGNFLSLLILWVLNQCNGIAGRASIPFGGVLHTHRKEKIVITNKKFTPSMFSNLFRGGDKKKPTTPSNEKKPNDYEPPMSLAHDSSSSSPQNRNSEDSSDMFGSMSVHTHAYGSTGSHST